MGQAAWQGAADRHGQAKPPRLRRFVLDHDYVRISKLLREQLLAEELRLSMQALGEITGEFSSEDLLGRIFASFCIGK